MYWYILKRGIGGLGIGISSLKLGSVAQGGLNGQGVGSGFRSGLKQGSHPLRLAKAQFGDHCLTYIHALLATASTHHLHFMGIIVVYNWSNDDAM